MSTLTKFVLGLAVAASTMLLAALAVADWDEGDGHKMHFPQLPDPNGWDVAWSNSWLGDDWVCSGSGPVSDIHLWVSFKEWNEDYAPEYMSQIPFAVQIWSNDPGGAGSQYSYSTPKDLLWDKTFEPGEFSIRYAGCGPQGWYWPASGTALSDDHQSYFQINMDIDPQLAYSQTEGEVYWLVTKFEGIAPQIGWKTADLNRYPDPYNGQHFMDDAVFGTGITLINWEEISIYGISRDLAFVITPEPGTLVLLVTAGLGLLLFVWRRRK